MNGSAVPLNCSWWLSEAKVLIHPAPFDLGHAPVLIVGMLCTLQYQNANHVVRTKCWSRKGRGMWEDLRLKRLKVMRSQGQIRCYWPAQTVRQAHASTYGPHTGRHRNTQRPMHWLLGGRHIGLQTRHTCTQAPESRSGGLWHQGPLVQNVHKRWHPARNTYITDYIPLTLGSTWYKPHYNDS